MRPTAVARLIAAVLFGLLGAGACTGRDSAPEMSALPSDPATLVLRVTELHSNPYPWDRGQLPSFSLFGGGRVIDPGSTVTAWRSGHDYQLSDGRFRELVAQAYAAGLAQAATYDRPEQSDASALLVTLRTAEGLRTTQLVDPGEAGDSSRRRILDFVRHLPATPDNAPEYQPVALAVLATGGVSADNTQPQAWPLYPLGTGTRTREGLCRVVTGAEMDRARELVGTQLAAKDSRWLSGDKTFAVALRPLLPDEHTCEDIDKH